MIFFVHFIFHSLTLFLRCQHTTEEKNVCVCFFSSLRLYFSFIFSKSTTNAPEMLDVSTTKLLHIYLKSKTK